MHRKLGTKAFCILKIIYVRNHIDYTQLHAFMHVQAPPPPYHIVFHVCACEHIPVCLAGDITIQYHFFFFLSTIETVFRLLPHLSINNFSNLDYMHPIREEREGESTCA